MPTITITVYDDPIADRPTWTTTLSPEEVMGVMESAQNERRDPAMQTTVLVATALGLWHTHDADQGQETSKAATRKRATRPPRHGASASASK